MAHPNPVVTSLPEIAAWTAVTAAATYAAARRGMPIVLGGDHSLSAGTLAGLARHAAELRRPLFVLWLDAHPDFHTLDTTESGNLHGVGLAYACGLPGFGDYFPVLGHRIDVRRRVCALGIRSRRCGRTHRLGASGRAGARHAQHRRTRHCRADARLSRPRGGGGRPAACELRRPSISSIRRSPRPSAPWCHGGATFRREAHLVMELLHDSGRVTSLDLVELNPLLRRARPYREPHRRPGTASLFGRSVLDRPSQAL